jgi:hypothetical protein
VKSRSQIEGRLKKLRMRYAQKHVDQTQQRCFRNCEFNLEHKPALLQYKAMPTELELAPRHQQTTLVIHEEGHSVHLCMYGAKDASTWPGDTCEDDDKARHCPMFKPRINLQQARSDFMEKMFDDEYVFNNYRDVATLQWVLGERVHTMGLSLWERFWFWLKIKFWKPIAPLPNLPEASLPIDLWYDPSTNDPPAPPRS